MEDNTSKLSF